MERASKDFWRFQTLWPTSNDLYFLLKGCSIVKKILSWVISTDLLPWKKMSHFMLLVRCKSSSVGYEHRSLENPLGSLENLPARRALVLEMLEKIFAQFSLGSVCARKKLRSSSLGSIFLCSKCSICARYGSQNMNYSWWILYSLL